jgi:hypothetical protein
MCHNYIKLITLLLLASPIASFAMELPPPPPNFVSLEAEAEVLFTPFAPSAEITSKILEFRKRDLSRARRLELLADIAPYMDIRRTEADMLWIAEAPRLPFYEPQKYMYTFSMAELNQATKQKVYQRLEDDEVFGRRYNAYSKAFVERQKKYEEFKNPNISRERKLELLPDVAELLDIRLIDTDNIIISESEELHWYGNIKRGFLVTLTDLNPIARQKVEARLQKLKSDREAELTTSQRLHAYWNSLHPVAKTGVAIGSAVASSYCAKKLYELMQKRK